jgi:enamine deaminase RidA (YjgF/YER057c/UK114 family)
MPTTLVNPAGLAEVPIYRHVSVSSGSRIVFIAGQTALDPEGNRIGEGDLTAQVEQVYLNLHTALAGVGASFDQVAKVTVYFVDWTADKMGPFIDGMARASARLGIEPPVPPLTGIGVAALAEPWVLVEVEAVAVLD